MNLKFCNLITNHFSSVMFKTPIVFILTYRFLVIFQNYITIDTNKYVLITEIVIMVTVGCNCKYNQSILFSGYIYKLLQIQGWSMKKGTGIPAVVHSENNWRSNSDPLKKSSGN